MGDLTTTKPTKRLPKAKDAPTAGVAPLVTTPVASNIMAQPAQTQAAGLVSDVAMDRFATMLMRIPDPDAVLRQAGMRREDLVRLEYDDEISGALDTRREAAISTKWKLEDEAEGDKKKAGTAEIDKKSREKNDRLEGPQPVAGPAVAPVAKDKDESKDPNDTEDPDSPLGFVRGELQKVFDTFMRGVWAAVPYGYSVSEAVYEPRDNGRIGVNRIGIKPLQWFEPLRDGRLVYVEPTTGQRIDCDQTKKFLLTTRNATYANPFGEALLSRLYWAWFFRHVGWKSWMQFVERFGDPFVVGNTNQPKDLVEALLGMGIKNVIGVDMDTQINVLLQSGDSTFANLDSRLSERIQKTILGQTLTSGTSESGGGAYALGKVHENVRQDKRVADTRIMTKAGQWLVDALWGLNQFPGNAPKFVFEDEKDIDLARAERDNMLHASGMIEFSAAYYMREYNLDPDDVVSVNKPAVAPALDPLGDPKPNPNVGAPGGGRAVRPGQPPKPGQKPPTAQARKLAEPDDADLAVLDRPGATPAQKAVDALADAALEDAPEGPLSSADIRLAIIGAKDRDDLEARLAALLDRQSPTWAETLSRAIFAADILGYLHSDEGQ